MKSPLSWFTQWVLSVCVATLAAAGSASAQQPVPPENYTVDPRGVDLVTGAFIYPVTEVVIGQPGAGGLVHGRVFLAGGGVRDNQLGTVTVSGSTYIVSVSGESEIFTKSGSTFTPQTNRGATLTQFGSAYTFTSASGAVSHFFSYYAGVTTPYGSNPILLSDYTQPNGEVTTYNYNGVTYCRLRSEEGECLEEGSAARLQSITNNRGYLLHYDYESDDPDQIFQWIALQAVTGINTAVDYCGPAADDCTGLSRTWPSVTYGSGGSGPTATDEIGRVTTYTGGPNGLGGIRLPGSSSDDVSLTTNTSQQTTALTDGSGAWAYSYTDVGTTRTTVATGPLGQSMTAVSDLTIGRATSVTQVTSVSPPVSRTWTYAYDSQRRLERITNPEGDYVQYAFDSRGNVTTTTAVPKSGSGLSNIVTSAAYPSTCPNVITCNRPTSTMDGRGAVTDYVWNTTHGGLDSVTEPAPTTGAVRPQTRITYAAQTAYYKNSGGTIVAAPSAITLPTVTSVCATFSSCSGTSDEIRTTVAYGSTGVANNLLPTSTTSGDGTGALAATTTVTYDPNGDVATMDGPLSTSADTTTYRYDTARRLTGVIGPDPDGGGALLNRAQSLTLNDRDQPTLVELGTTSGVNWSTFSPLQRQSAVYGTYARTLQVAAETAAGVKQTLAQFSYDAAGRLDCTAVRMNPALWGSLPGSACTAQSAGGFGPDRISQTSYDAAGRLISSTSGLGSSIPITESVTYTANGRAATVSDGRSSTSAMEYDGFDRPARLRYPDPSTGSPSTTDDELYGYDDNSNPVSFTNRANQVATTTVDALNRVTALSAPGGADSPTYTYDNVSRLVTAALPGRTTTQTWDALSRLTAQTGVLGTMAFQYDLAGRRTQLMWPDMVAVTYDWDWANDPTAIRQSGGTLIAGYGYDNLGRRTAITRSNGVSTAYGYDGISRLASLSHDLPGGTTNDVAWTYTYNPANQIQTRTQSNALYNFPSPGVSTAYANDRLNRVTTVGGASTTYDGNSNLTYDATTTYAYDARNRLIGASTGGTLAYDPLGRLRQYSGTAGGEYLYDGGELTAVTTNGTSVNNRLVRGFTQDELVMSFQGNTFGTPYFSLTDERNSVVAITDPSGGLIVTNAYDEYGVPRSGNGGRAQYTGQLWLPDFSAYYYKARVYQPRLGRFLQTDLVGYGAGANLYAYVEGDPINWTDPFGLQATSVDDIVVNGVHCPRSVGHIEREYGHVVCVTNVTTVPGTPGPSGDGPGVGGRNGSGTANTNQPACPVQPSTGTNAGTTGEWAQALRNPDAAFLANRLASEAENATSLRFPGVVAHNNAGDAYRHFMWSFSMVGAVGPEEALRFGFAHEVSHYGPANERIMDLRNNMTGVAFALDPRYRDQTPQQAANNALELNCLQTSP